MNYYWIDYREFANVTKYRLAMMRREIEVKSQQVSWAYRQVGEEGEEGCLAHTKNAPALWL